MEVPVLVLAFNRPGLLEKLISRLLEVSPRHVFVAVDGPRRNHPSDEEKIEAVKKIVDQTPWPGQITTLYRPENRGCRRGVGEAITWFFESVSEGIILEDDCLPDHSFFPYAAELLARYRSAEHIGMISGGTFFPSSSEEEGSYTFSHYPHIWGWATWARAWNRFDSELDGWNKSDANTVLKRVSGGSRSFERFWAKHLEHVLAHKIDSWAYVWAFSMWQSQMVSIAPSRNLVRNTGFVSEATHTGRKPFGRAFRPNSETIDFPLSHPEQMLVNSHRDFLVRELSMGVHGKSTRTFLRVLWAIGLRSPRLKFQQVNSN